MSIKPMGYLRVSQEEKNNYLRPVGQNFNKTSPFKSDSSFIHPLKAKGNWKKGRPREFQESLDAKEKSSLRCILETLSKKSFVKILALSKKLSDHGKELDHVHPISFFIGIFTDDHHKRHFHELKKKKGKPWKEFLKGAVESFKEERRHNNIHVHHIETFSKLTNKDFHALMGFSNSQNWEGFINDL